MLKSVCPRYSECILIKQRPGTLRQTERLIKQDFLKTVIMFTTLTPTFYSSEEAEDEVSMP